MGTLMFGSRDVLLPAMEDGIMGMVVPEFTYLFPPVVTKTGPVLKQFLGPAQAGHPGYRFRRNIRLDELSAA